MWAKKDKMVSFDEVKERMQKCEKDFDQGAFDVAPAFFRVQLQATNLPVDDLCNIHTFSAHLIAACCYQVPNPKDDWVNDRVNLYFVDGDILPLMVAENYLSARPSIGRGEITPEQQEKNQKVG